MDIWRTLKNPPKHNFLYLHLEPRNSLFFIDFLAFLAFFLTHTSHKYIYVCAKEKEGSLFAHCCCLQAAIFGFFWASSCRFWWRSPRMGDIKKSLPPQRSTKAGPKSHRRRGLQKSYARGFVCVLLPFFSFSFYRYFSPDFCVQGSQTVTTLLCDFFERCNHTLRC